MESAAEALETGTAVILFILAVTLFTYMAHSYEGMVECVYDHKVYEHSIQETEQQEERMSLWETHTGR